MMCHSFEKKQNIFYSGRHQNMMSYFIVCISCVQLLNTEYQVFLVNTDILGYKRVILQEITQVWPLTYLSLEQGFCWLAI